MGPRWLCHPPGYRGWGEQERLGEGGEQGCAPQGQAAWALFLPQPLPSCVTLGKALGLSVPQILTL